MSKRNIRQLVEETRNIIEDRNNLKVSEIQRILADSGNDPAVAIMDAFTYGFAMGMRQERKRKAPECHQEPSKN